MAEYTGEERRQFPRVKSNFNLDVVPSKTRRGQAQNISQQGLLFEHQGSLEVDSMIDVSLRVPGLTGTITVKAKVIRSDPTGIGEGYRVAVNFVNTDEETEQAIKDLLENY